MPLSIEFLVPPDAPAIFRQGSHTNLRLKKSAEETMAATGSLRSGSGQSAKFAIDWCEANNFVWTLSGCHQYGYSVQRGDKLE